jgi:membrane dipeptidase
MVVQTKPKLTVDAHVDALWVRYKRSCLEKACPPALTLAAMKTGGLNSAFFALYLPEDLQDQMSQEEVDLAMEWQIQEFQREYASQAEHPQFLAMESGRLLGGSIRRLEHYARLGIRYLTLTHNRSNELGDSATDKYKHNGLSALGEKIVVAADELDVLLDVSHVSDRTAAAIMEKSFNPVIASHSGCRALCDHSRNLPDDLIRSIVKENGVVHIPFARNFIGTGHRVCEHIDHVVQLTGTVNGVGIGSDLDGAVMVTECPDVSKWIDTTGEALYRKGYTQAELDKITGQNTLRLFWRNKLSTVS